MPQKISGSGAEPQLSLSTHEFCRRAPIIFIPPESLDHRRLADLWSQVILDARQDAVVEGLRIIEPELSQIIFLPIDYGFRQSHAPLGIVAITPASPRPVPLGSMGDGMRRLLALAISLSRATTGVLLIDEIDSGLHYSVLAAMWKLVVETAKRHDIQVFATTHSWDCVNALGVLCRRHPELMEHVCIQKIDRALDHSVPFQGEALVKAVESGVELR